MLPPGGTIALAEGAYYGHKQLFDHLAPVGRQRRRVRPDRRAARRRRPDPDRGALEPDADDARLRGSRRAPAPVVCDATLASPLRLRPLELGCDVSLHSATKVLGGPRRPPRRSRHRQRRRPLRPPAPHAPADRPRRLGRHGLAARARPEDARGAARPDGGDRADPRRAPERAPRRDDRALPGLRIPDRLRRRRRRRRPGASRRRPR